MFSWSISSPFAILHADLWLPCHFIDRNGNIALMNIMCDMTRFIIVIPVPNKTAATLAEHFIQHVLLIFDICLLVILDDGSPFKGFFTAMYKDLYINYDILAKRILQRSSC